MPQPVTMPEPTRRAAPARPVRWAVVLTVVCPVAVWALWRVFVATLAGQQVEQIAFDGAEYGQSRLWVVAGRVLDVVSVGFVAAAAITAVVVAVARRRRLLAGQAVLLVAGANLTTQLVKVWLPREDLGTWRTYGNTLPSGHTTVAASVSAALVLVVPPRARPAVALLGAAYTAATGVSTLVARWHRPSDVVAATLVVLGWAALVCLLDALRQPSVPTATGALPSAGAPRRAVGGYRAVLTTLVAIGAAAGVVALVALARTWTVRAGFADRTDELLAYAGGAAAMCAAAAWTFAALLVLRRPT